MRRGVAWRDSGSCWLLCVVVYVGERKPYDHTESPRVHNTELKRNQRAYALLCRSLHAPRSNAAGQSAGGSRQRCQATAPRSALRASLGRSLRLTSLRAPRVARTPQTQPASRRAEACGATGRLPGCGARAFKRSLAEVVRDGAFGGRTLARALPRS